MADEDSALFLHSILSSLELTLSCLPFADFSVHPSLTQPHLFADPRGSFLTLWGQQM